MSLQVWGLDGFDPRASFSAGFWRYSDAIRYVVGKVAMGPVLNAWRSKERRGWVALRWQDIAPLFGKSGKWNDIRREALDRDILECDESYAVGERSKQYRVGHALWGYKAARITLRDGPTATLIGGHDEAIATDQDRWVPEHHHLAKWLALTTVDAEMAKPWIGVRHEGFSQQLTALKIETINGGGACIKVDRYGRVHSPVVNLPRFARSALRIGGLRLAEIDISNSQPLIIAYLVAKVITGEWSIRQVRALGKKRPFHGYNQTQGKTGAPKQGKERWKDNSREASQQKGEKNARHTLCLPLLHLCPWVGALPDDLINYLDVCQSGHFYQAMADVWGLPYQTHDEKNEVKCRTFKHVLFGRPRPGESCWEAVRDRWPSVASVLEAVKVRDKGRAARACQRIESSLMIGGVVGRFLADHPDIPIQTIHDSVLVPTDTVDLARDTILKVFGSIGLTPGIKIKSLV
jgi:hypothetical protein